jgi:uncharacterized protein YdbL (DUF1318 family)
MKRFLTIFLAIAALTSSLLHGADMDALKERFRLRKPAIDELKAQGIVGENNRGYLDFRADAPAPAQQELVNAENGDRKALYEAIAQQTSTSADLVGRRRALQIVEEAAPGQWIQNEDGSWRQK